LDVNKEIIGKIRIGHTFQLDVARYTTPLNDVGSGLVSKLDGSGKKNNKLKFTLRASGERNFKKDIGIPMGTKEVKIYLGLKSPYDTDPDIAPDSLKWD